MGLLTNNISKQYSSRNDEKTYGRMASVVAGLLFLIATVAGVIAAANSTSVLSVPDYFEKIADNALLIKISAVCVLIMGFCCAAIGVVLYPVLRRYNETLAVGALSFRVMEGVFEVTAGVLLVTVVFLTGDSFTSGVYSGPELSVFGDLLLLLRAGITHIAMILTWSIGALFYYIIFFRFRVLPRWISLWGIAGIILAIAGSILYLFQLISPMGRTHMLLNFPIALQEMVMALWLITKGLDLNAK